MYIGRHRLFCEIASGGTASVHLACLTGPGSFASVNAVKRLHPHLAREDAFRKMLLDEARVSARVVHPNVARTLDVLEEGDDVFIVMEYVLGLSLARVLQITSKLETNVPVDIAVGVVVGMLRGLHASHEALDTDGAPLGIVHRDVSPQNVLVGADGVTRLIDFGVAKARSRLTTTEGGFAKGKHGYMAPEQLLGEPLGRETDVFGSGVVLWELIAGARLFPADSAYSATTRRIHTDVDRRPSQDGARRRHDVPEALDDAALKALKIDRALRFPTALAMAEALAAIAPPATPETIAAWLDDVSGGELDILRERVAYVERQAQEEIENGTNATSDVGGTTVVSTPHVEMLAHDELENPAPAILAPPRPPDTNALLTMESRGRHMARTHSGRALVTLLGVLLGFAIAIPLLLWTRRSTTAASLGQETAWSAESSGVDDSTNDGARDEKTTLIASASASTTSSSVDTAPPAPSSDGVSAAEAPSVGDVDVSPENLATDTTGNPSSEGDRAKASTRAPTASPKARATRPQTKTKACSPPYTFDDSGHKLYKPECF